MAGLFEDPTDVGIAEAQARAASDPSAMLRGSLFNLGQAGGGAMMRGFGGDPRSPLQKRAGEVQGIARQIDFQDPASIMQGINNMNQAGFQAEAFKLFSALPAGRKPEKVITSRFVQDEQVGNTTKRFLFERDNFGFTHKVGEISSTAKTDPLFKHDVSFQKDVRFNEASKASFLGRMAQRPEFKSFVDDTDPEELVQFTGLVQKVANDLKESHREQISQAFLGGQVDSQQATLMTSKSDDWYLDKAYERFVQGGGIEANIDRGFDIAGADVVLAPGIDTTDPTTLLQNQVQTSKRAKAISDVAARTGELVVGDPRTGGFTLKQMNPAQAREVFSRLDNKTDDMLIQQLEGQGFQFTPEMLESHSSRWQLMRENPVATAKFLSLADSPDLREAEVTRYLDELQEGNNFQGFANSAAIFQYLRRIGGEKGVTAQPGRGRGRIR